MPIELTLKLVVGSGVDSFILSSLLLMCQLADYDAVWCFTGWLWISVLRERGEAFRQAGHKSCLRFGQQEAEDGQLHGPPCDWWTTCFLCWGICKDGCKAVKPSELNTWSVTIVTHERQILRLPFSFHLQRHPLNLQWRLIFNNTSPEMFIPIFMTCMFVWVADAWLQGVRGVTWRSITLGATRSHYRGAGERCQGAEER